MFKFMRSMGFVLGLLASLSDAGEIGEKLPTGLSAGQYAALKAKLQQKAATEIERARLKQVLAHRADDKAGFLESVRQEEELVRQFATEQKQLDDRFSKEGNLVDKIRMGFSQTDILKEIERQRLETARRETLDRLRGEGKIDQNARAIGETSAERARGQLEISKQVAKAVADAQKGFRADLRVTRNPPARRFTVSGKGILRPAQPTRNPITAKPILRARPGKVLSAAEAEDAVTELTRRTIDRARKSGALSNETAAELKAAAESQRETANQIRAKEENLQKLAVQLKNAQSSRRQ